MRLVTPVLEPAHHDTPPAAAAAETPPAAVACNTSHNEVTYDSCRGWRVLSYSMYSELMTSSWNRNYSELNSLTSLGIVVIQRENFEYEIFKLVYLETFSLIYVRIFLLAIRRKTMLNCG